MKTRDGLLLVLWCLCVAQLLKGGAVPSVFAPTPDKVTYVWDKNQHTVPPAVRAVLDKLNRDTSRKIVASDYEVGTTDGTGPIPEQYQVPDALAKAAGLPAFVVTGGGKEIKTLGSVPKNVTEEKLMEAVP